MDSVYSIIAIYLSLIGILGTFFYIHLSGWLQNLFMLKAKVQINKLQTDADQSKAIRECKYEIKGLLTHIPFLIAVIISLFIGLLWKDSSYLLSTNSDDLALHLRVILDVFIVVYFTLTSYLLLHGYLLGFWIWRTIKKK